MAELRLLADMHISPRTVRDLSAAGLDVVRVSDVLAASSPDPDILAFAREHDRVLITQDLDFSALLAFGGHSRPSVVTLRLRHAPPSLVTRRVLDVVAALSEELGNGAIISVDETSARYRPLPMAGDWD